MQTPKKLAPFTNSLTQLSNSRTVTPSGDGSSPSSSKAGVPSSTLSGSPNPSSVDTLPSTTFISTPLHIERRPGATGPAVGGTIGGLVVIAILVGFLLWRKRRSRTNELSESTVANSGPPGHGYTDEDRSPTFNEKTFQTHLDSNLAVLPKHAVSSPPSDADIFLPDSSLSNMFVSSPSSVSHDHSCDGLYDSYTHDGHGDTPSLDPHDLEMGFTRSGPGTSWATNGAHVKTQTNEPRTRNTDASDYVLQEINAGPRRPHYLSLLSIASIIPSIRQGSGASTPHSSESQRSGHSIRALPVPPLPSLPSLSTPSSSSSLRSPAGSMRRPLPSPKIPSAPPPRKLPSIRQSDSSAPS